MHWIDVGHLFAAVIAGAVIGFERELHNKPAGFRTNIMICLGAALFTLLSVRMAELAGNDRTRIAAQIVTGVGFLGAGAIVQFRSNVLGLTTAATIWTVASVGMAFGAGEFLLGTAATILTTLVLFGLGYAEQMIGRWRTAATYEIEMEASADAAREIEEIVRKSGVFCRSWTVTKNGNGIYIGHLSVVGPVLRIDGMQAMLMGSAAVRVMRRI